MWNDASVQRDAEASNPNPDQVGFVDAKGVEWNVVWRDLPERRGKIALDFASANGKRRSAELKVEQLDELRRLDDLAWRTLLANAGVIEME